MWSAMAKGLPVAAPERRKYSPGLVNELKSRTLNWPRLFAVSRTGKVATVFPLAASTSSNCEPAELPAKASFCSVGR